LASSNEEIAGSSFGKTSSALASIPALVQTHLRKSVRNRQVFAIFQNCINSSQTIYPNINQDRDLLWIAKEGLCAALPPNWKACQSGEDGDIFYFNFKTGESVWDHPCDAKFKELLQVEKSRRDTPKLAVGLICKVVDTSQGSADAKVTCNSTIGGEDLAVLQVARSITLRKFRAELAQKLKKPEDVLRLVRVGKDRKLFEDEDLEKSLAEHFSLSAAAA
jgi:Splicing factor